MARSKKLTGAAKESAAKKAAEAAKVTASNKVAEAKVSKKVADAAKLDINRNESGPKKKTAATTAPPPSPIKNQGLRHEHNLRSLPLPQINRLQIVHNRTQTYDCPLVAPVAVKAVEASVTRGVTTTTTTSKKQKPKNKVSSVILF